MSGLPEGWKLVKLQDVSIAISAGGTPRRNVKEYWNEGTIPWIKISDMKNTYIAEAEEKITEEGLKNSSAKLFPKGTLLYSIFATLGAVGILEIEATTNQAIAGITPNKQFLDTKYLYYCLLSEEKKIHSKKSHATQDNLNLTILRNHEIPLPPLPVQQRIVAVLENAEQLREWRKEADGLTDEYLRSVFLEMFGDPVRNEKGWEIKKIDDVIASMEAGWSANGEQRQRKENEYGVLKVSAVTRGFFLPEEHKALNENLDLKKLVTPEKGDVIFSRANTLELVGATCLIRENYPKLLLPDKLWKIKVNTDLILPAVFKFILSHGSMRVEISKNSTGTSGSMYNISMAKLKSISMPVPPLDIQEKFSTLYDNLETIREQQAQSRQHIDELFESLMQKAFHGGLN